MTRSLLAAACVRPVWSVGDGRVAGPDEDGFTLAVAALERVLGGVPTAFPGGFDQVDLVGEFPSDVETLVPSAFGWADIEVRRHPGGAGSVAQAIRNAAHASGPGGSAVVAVDGGGTLDSAGHVEDAVAVAAAFGTGKGATFLGASSRHHPPERRPDASQWIAAARRSAPDSTESTKGVLGFAAPASPPVLLAEWARAFPNVKPVHLAWTPGASERGASALPFVTAARAAHHAAAGDTIWAAAIRPERTDFLAFHVDAPVTWLGPFEPTGSGRPLPPTAAPDAPLPNMNAVSQGAYVPRATYLENLAARWRFLGETCAACGAVTFPPRGRCDRCRATEGLSPIELPKSGLEVEAATVVAPGAQPTEFDGQVRALGPYAVVLARLAPGVRATLQVTDSEPGAAVIGARVDTVLRRLYSMEGSWRYGRKAIVVDTTGAPAPRPAPSVP